MIIHAGMPIEGEPWREFLHEIAQFPNLNVKLSGQGTFIHRVDPDWIKTVTQVVVDEFGSDRAMFGTNFPVESIWTDFSSLVNAWFGVLAGFPQDVQDDILGRTARRVYRLAGGLNDDPSSPTHRQPPSPDGCVRAGGSRLGCSSRSRAPRRWTSARRCTSTTRAGSKARSPAAASRARSPRRRWRCSRPAARPSSSTYGISDELAGTVGLMCGGIVHIFIHEIRAEHQEAVLADLQATIDHTPAGLVTLLDGENAGAKLFVDAERTIGSLGQGELLDKNAKREAQGLLDEGRSSLRDFGEDGASLGSGLRVYNSIQAEPPRMVVFGAIDFSSALAPLAKGLGYRVTIADPRSAFLKSRRFSAAAETEVGWPDAVLDGVELGPRDSVLIFTHDPKLDVPAVQAALKTGAGYIGALGSRNTTVGPQPAAPRRRRDRRGDRPHLRALWAGHRRFDG